MTDTGFGLSTIGQLLVPVTDVERATAFYRDQLGVPFLFSYPGMAFLDAGGVRLFLAVPESPASSGHVTIYFRVPDIDAAFAALRGRGVAFTDEPHVVHRGEGTELWMAFTQDPDGNSLGIMEDRPLA